MRIFSWDVFSRNRDRVYGLAIMMVMAYHYLEDVAEVAAGQVPGWLGCLAGFNHYFIAQSSLEWFVFLSGMGLYFSMEKDPSARRFWRRRLGRVLVPYLLVGVPYWLYRDLIFHFRGPAAFFKDLFFITFLTKRTVVFWYIVFIAVMYLIYPLLYRWLKKGRHIEGGAVLFMAGWILVILGLNRVVPDLAGNINIALARVLTFFAGSVCGRHIYKKEPFTIRKGWMFFPGLPMKIIVLLSIFSGARVPGDIIRITGVFYGLFLLVPVVLAAGRLPQCLEICGKYSLELYLTHISLRSLLKIHAVGTHIPLVYLGVLVLSFAASLLLHRGARTLGRRIMVPYIPIAKARGFTATFGNTKKLSFYD